MKVELSHVLGVAALAVPSALFAGAVGSLVTFSNGTVADANDVNANFAAVQTAVDDNDTRLTAVEGAVSGPVFQLPTSSGVPAGSFSAGAMYFDRV
jgi:hypothetical protein